LLRRDKATSGTLAEAAKMACRVGGKAMKRRSKTGGNASKSARHKATTVKRRRTPPKAGPGRRSATTTQETEIARLTRERDEALEQQTATSEVLQIISSSPGDLEPVFSVMLGKAVQICDASYGNIYRWDGDALHYMASYNTPKALVRVRKGEPLRPDRLHPLESRSQPNRLGILPTSAKTPLTSPGSVPALSRGSNWAVYARPCSCRC
jgi:hypothetical protein